MATARALSLALLLALCLAACACASAPRQPTNRYISYAPGWPHARGGNGAGHSGNRHGVSALTGRRQAAPGGVPTLTKAGAKTAAAVWKGAYMSHAALPRDKRPAPKNAGAKTGAAGPKGKYISRAAVSRDKLCGRFGCASRP